jgi:hypothetical protein
VDIPKGKVNFCSCSCWVCALHWPKFNIVCVVGTDQPSGLYILRLDRGEQSSGARDLFGIPLFVVQP